MAKVLYIKSNPKSVEHSYSLQVSEAFINKYKEMNPGDSIVEIDLNNMEVPNIDYDVMGAWGKLQQGIAYTELTKNEQQKLAAMEKNVGQFMEADKYIIESPLWNFTVPAVLKAYVDNVLVAGKTFKYTETGPIGLLDNKKAIHIQARGGFYSEEPMKSMEMGDTYLRNALSFIGVTDYQSVIIEGTSMGFEVAQQNKENAVKKALELAKEF